MQCGNRSAYSYTIIISFPAVKSKTNIMYISVFLIKIFYLVIDIGENV